MDFSTWSISDYAAWWGAIIASLTLIWNIIIVLRTGPRISVRATPDMVVVPSGPLTENKTFISVTAVNRGTAPTTITHFCGYYAANLWDLIRKKHRNFIVQTHPGLGKDVPYLLSPGQEWSSMAIQEDIEKNFGNGYL